MRLSVDASVPFSIHPALGLIITRKLGSQLRTNVQFFGCVSSGILSWPTVRNGHLRPKVVWTSVDSAPRTGLVTGRIQSGDGPTVGNAEDQVGRAGLAF